MGEGREGTDKFDEGGGEEYKTWAVVNLQPALQMGMGVVQ